jgi:hypothetical protein
MAESALAKKLKLKPGMRAAIVDAPEGYLDELAPLPEGVQMTQELAGQQDWVQIFVKNKAAMEALLSRAVSSLKPSGMLWISFPKGSSKVQTDLTRDKGWESLQSIDLKWLSLVSVNDTWSAFALRPYKPGEARQSFR